MKYPDYWNKYPDDVRKMMVSLADSLWFHKAEGQPARHLNLYELETSIRVFYEQKTIYRDFHELIDEYARALHLADAHAFSTWVMSIFGKEGDGSFWMLLHFITEFSIQEAVPTLIAMLSTDVGSAMTAVSALGKLKAASAVQPILVAIKERKIFEGAGMKALAQIGTPEVQPLIEEYQAKLDWPQSLDEAVDRLVHTLDAESIKTIRETPKEQLALFHHGFGTGLRNGFGLWGDNRKLLESCGVDPSSPFSGDTASGIIIDSLWERLQNAFDSGVS